MPPSTAALFLFLRHRDACTPSLIAAAAYLMPSDPCAGRLVLQLMIRMLADPSIPDHIVLMKPPPPRPCFLFYLRVVAPSCTQSTPVNPLVSAVGHVLTLVAGLAGGLAGSTGALERHPALGSLLRALCIRIPDTSVRRSACAVLYRASHWQALGRDASSSASAATAGEGLAARPSNATAVPPGTSAVLSSPTSAAGKRRRGRSNDLARALLACLRADLARVQTVPFARSSSGPGAAVRVGLSPVRRARGGASTAVAAAADKTGGGGGGGGVVPVVVPRLHLVEVTSFVSGLVHVMLESAPSSAATAVAAAGPKEQQLPTERGSGRQPPTRQPPPLPSRPSVLPADAAHRDGKEGGGASRRNNAGMAAASTAAAGDDLPGVGAGGVDGGEGGGEEGRPSIAAAEWLLEEAARRLVAHEFTETFK